jgi:hypothetical protein
MASKTFEIDGLAPQNCSTPTSMRDEIILIAWLIVLMRVQESSLVRCEWQYQGSPQELENGDAVRSLSPNDVTIGLQSHTGLLRFLREPFPQSQKRNKQLSQALPRYV